MLLKVNDLFLQGMVKPSGLSLIRAGGGLQGVKAVFDIKLIPFGNGGCGIVAQGAVRVQDAFSETSRKYSLKLLYCAGRPEMTGAMAEYFMRAMSCFFCCSIDMVPPFFDDKRSIRKIIRECTAGYVGGGKNIFGVFFICMNCFPKRERHCFVSWTKGRRAIRSDRRRSLQ